MRDCMDDIELMVAETFKHFHENFAKNELAKDNFPQEMAEQEDELPTGPGLLYHLQKTSSLFVIRTLVSHNIREDYQKIFAAPEDYPSLRLLEGGAGDIEKKLRFFILETHLQGEIIHDQVCNRRFPINEEIMCNLSDPGFSWWLTKKNSGFQLSFTMSVSDNESIKLGPIGDQQLAMRSFQHMENLMQEAGLNLNIQNESNRVQFNEGEEFLLEEIKDLFEYGVVGQGMSDLFKLLARRIHDHSQLETVWLYLQEIAAMRRFWIQIQYDLSN
jgi:hypothetical protein